MLLGVGWWAFAGAKALAVHVAAARPMPDGAAGASVLDATGYVTARREATVSAQITGTVTAVLIEEGDHVKLGQVIGRLDDTAQRAALAQAQAALNSAPGAAHPGPGATRAERSRSEARAKVSSNAAWFPSRPSNRRAHRSMRRARRCSGSAGRLIWRANLRSAQVQLDYCTVRAPFPAL